MKSSLTRKTRQPNTSHTNLSIDVVGDCAAVGSETGATYWSARSTVTASDWAGPESAYIRHSHPPSSSCLSKSQVDSLWGVGVKRLQILRQPHPWNATTTLSSSTFNPIIHRHQTSTVLMISQPFILECQNPSPDPSSHLFMFLVSSPHDGLSSQRRRINQPRHGLGKPRDPRETSSFHCAYYSPAMQSHLCSPLHDLTSCNGHGLRYPTNSELKKDWTVAQS